MRRILACVLFLGSVLVAQEKVTFEDLPGIVLANDRISLTVIPDGGAMAAITLNDDKEKINPLWNPYWIAREARLNRPTNAYRGHFICVDGFGPASAEEQKAGLPMHGEAYTLPWKLDAFQQQNGTTTATFSVSLPLVHERLTRTYRIVNGENIVWVDSELENLLAFDRPVFWGEHATISAPFLAPGKVMVDMPVVKAKTKAYQTASKPARQLQSFVDFIWPLGPTTTGGTFDLRSAPLAAGTTEHVTSLLDPSRKVVYVTALHPERRLVIGWVFRREEFPWVQTWLSYPGPNRMTRGLEFATQPFDLPRAEVLRNGPLFDTLAYTIAPARSKVASSFLMFFANLPEGFQKVDDVQLTGGKLVIEDRTSKRSIALPASRAL